MTNALKLWPSLTQNQLIYRLRWLQRLHSGHPSRAEVLTTEITHHMYSIPESKLRLFFMHTLLEFHSCGHWSWGFLGSKKLIFLSDLPVSQPHQGHGQITMRPCTAGPQGATSLDLETMEIRLYIIVVKLIINHSQVRQNSWYNSIANYPQLKLTKIVCNCWVGVQVITSQQIHVETLEQLSLFLRTGQRLFWDLVDFSASRQFVCASWRARSFVPKWATVN